MGRYPATSFMLYLLLSVRSDAQPVSAEQTVLTDPIVRIAIADLDEVVCPKRP